MLHNHIPVKLPSHYSKLDNMLSAIIEHLEFISNSCKDSNNNVKDYSLDDFYNDSKRLFELLFELKNYKCDIRIPYEFFMIDDVELYLNKIKNDMESKKENEKNIKNNFKTILDEIINKEI